MTPEMWGRLGPFRDRATARGIPADDVERWLATARPCATLTRDGDGPVVGRFGGPLLLPADVPDPAHPYVASIDFAALPDGMTDLPLPSDGHLLLFAFPQIDYTGAGSAVYVPAGSAVAERDKLAWDDFGWEENERMMEAFPQGPMRARADVSLPCHRYVEVPGEWGGPLPGHPRSEELVEVWEDTRDQIAPEGSLQLGGYADEVDIENDPVAFAVKCAVEAGWGGSEDVADWVLLADWQMDVDDYESATVHWVIQREDLAARRFDRVFANFNENP